MRVGDPYTSCFSEESEHCADGNTEYVFFSEIGIVNAHILRPDNEQDHTSYYSVAPLDVSCVEE